MTVFQTEQGQQGPQISSKNLLAAGKAVSLFFACFFKHHHHHHCH